MQQRSKKVAEIIQRQDTLGKAVRLIESEVLAEKQGY
jgi:hypothetical protein